MSLFHFRVGDSDQTLSYDNVSNSLYDQNGHPLSNQELPPIKDFNRYGVLTKTKNPVLLKIVLGHGCNYSCGYCMQKDIGNPNERKTNSLTPMLIKSIRRHLNIDELERIELWGGETLLYWNDIKELMLEFDNVNLTWYIPTNGTLLANKHVDFFKTLKGTVVIGISHDGPGHDTTRGPEFLHRKVDVLRRIQAECYPRVQFSFNTVISRTNYDLFAINDFFYNFLTKHNLQLVTLVYELGRVYDSTLSQNSTHHVISGDDLPKYHQILTNYLSSHIEQIRTHPDNPTLLHTTLVHSGLGIIPLALSLKYPTPVLIKTSCGSDDSRTITMDMLGNIRACQNVDESYNSGNLMNIKGIRIKKMDVGRESHCISCGNYRVCKSSCPLDLGSEVFRINCALEKIHYKAIRTASLELLFGEKIIWVE